MAEKRSICLINDSFPPVIDGVANAVTNYASVIQRDYGDATVVTPYYPDADDSVYPFPVLRYPSIDMTKLVGYRAGFPLSAELMEQVEGRHIDLIHSHCPVTSMVLARMLRQRLNVPLVFTYHTKFDIDIANAIHSKLLQEASIKILVENISASDEVWAVSRGAGENLRSIGYTGDYVVLGVPVANCTGENAPFAYAKLLCKGFRVVLIGSAADEHHAKVVPLCGKLRQRFKYAAQTLVPDHSPHEHKEGYAFRKVKAHSGFCHRFLRYTTLWNVNAVFHNNIVAGVADGA